MTIDVDRVGPAVVVLPDGPTLARHAAEHIVTTAGAAVRERNEAHVALTGGSSPSEVYRILAAPPLRDRVPWGRVHLWWGDDRFVPRDDPRSNVFIADRDLLPSGTGRSGIPIPTRNVHPFPCAETIAAGGDADSCAAGYAAELRRLVPIDPAGWPVFDLLLVGIGADGHLLSVFPGSAAFDRPEWAVGIPAPTHTEPRVARVTLNPAVVASARAVLAIVRGAGKAAIVAAIFGPQRDPQRWPAQLALRRGATWLLDAAAAALLPFDAPAHPD